MDMRGSGLESPLDGSRVPVPPEHRRCSAHDAQTSLVYNDYNIMTIYIYILLQYYYNVHLNDLNVPQCSTVLHRFYSSTDMFYNVVQ